MVTARTQVQDLQPLPSTLYATTAVGLHAQSRGVGHEPGALVVVVVTGGRVGFVASVALVVAARPVVVAVVVALVVVARVVVDDALLSSLHEQKLQPFESVLQEGDAPGLQRHSRGAGQGALVPAVLRMVARAVLVELVEVAARVVVVVAARVVVVVTDEPVTHVHDMQPLAS
jgi:hypothetical protein